MKKKQQATSFVNKISFMRRTIRVQVSRKEKLTYNRFHEQKSAPNTFHDQKLARDKFHEKISFTMEEPIYKSHEEENQNATSFANKNQQAASFKNKIST